MNNDEDEYCCLICEKETESMDIPLCEEHKKWFDLDKLWKMHDNNELDALDFIEDDTMKLHFCKQEYHDQLEKILSDSE
jgi:hypothetical protein